MAFFDDLGKKFSQTGQDVVQKTKDTAEIMKINKAISEDQKRLEFIFTELGKAYFNAHPNDYDPTFGDFFSEINAANNRIADANERIKQLKGIVPCPKCGADVPVNAAFCSACGYSMPKPEPVPTPAPNGMITCPKCGTTMPAGSRFCVGCGEEMAAAPAPAPAPVQRTCANCGATVADGMAFCVNCGTKQ